MINKKLVLAATQGDLHTVKELLAFDLVRSAADEGDNKALQEAAKNGHIEIVNLLLNIEKVKNKASIDNNDILRLAAKNGHVEVVQALLTLNHVRNEAHAKNNEILKSVAKKGHIEIVKILLELESVKDIVNAEDNLVLQLAVEAGHVDVVKTLLQIDKVRNSVDVPDNHIFVCAVKHHNIKIAQLLLDLENVRDKADAKNNDALFFAVKNGNLEMVKFLLTIEKISSSAHGLHNEILWWSIESQHTEIVKLLLTLDNVQKTAEKDDANILSWAAEKRNINLIKELLTISWIKDHAAADDNSILSWAARDGDAELVKLLLEVDTIRNQADVNNNFALGRAAAFGHVEVVEALLQLENIRNNANALDNAALRYAGQKGYSKIFKLLLDTKSIFSSLDEEKILNLLNNSLETTFTLESVNLMMHALGRPSLTDSPEDKQQSWLMRVESHLAKPTLNNNPYGAAKSILEAYTNYRTTKEEEIDNFDDFDGDDESSMNDNLVTKVNKKFTEQIRPLLQNKFDESGDELSARLAAIELKIKMLILKQIKKAAEFDHNQEIIQFIDSNEEEIFQDNELMTEARGLFTSNSIASHAAWRCYDSEAGCTDWNNFFIEPTQIEADIPIFTTEASSDEALSLREACQIVRERIAYYYLLIEHEPDTERKQGMEEDLILYLAEIRRAHNTNDWSEDEPSCFPGTLTRLACITHKSSFCEETAKKQEILEKILIKEVEKTFKYILKHRKALEKYKPLFPEAESRRALCAEISDAITGINYNNAIDVLKNDARTNLGYSINVFTSEHVKARELFCNQMIRSTSLQDSLIPFIIKIEDELQKTNQEWFITPVDRAYILFFMASLSHHEEVCNRLAALYSRNFPSTEKKGSEAKDALNSFEVKIGFLKRQLSFNLQDPNHCRLVNQRKRLEEQNTLFKTITEIPLNKPYTAKDIEEAVEELTVVSMDSRLRILSVWQQELAESDKRHTLPCFFPNLTLTEPSNTFSMVTDLSSEESQALESMKLCSLLRDNLKQITNLFKSALNDSSLMLEA